MSVNVKVNWKFRFNGREYGSVEEMPAEAREAWEKAKSRSGGVVVPSIPGRITFNGKSYESIEEMSPGDRALYEGVMRTVRDKAVEGGAGREAPPLRGQGAEEPSSAPVLVRRILVAAVLVALAWFLTSWMRSAPPSP